MVYKVNCARQFNAYYIELASFKTSDTDHSDHCNQSTLASSMTVWLLTYLRQVLSLLFAKENYSRLNINFLLK